MSKMDYLGTYAEGWTNGDSATILSVVSDAFIFDDPNAGKISKADFPEYFSGLKAAATSMRGADQEGAFMELSEVITMDGDDGLTASCWWEILGTNIQGSGLIKVANDGVVSEQIAYYTKLPS
jgi:hypothetical protein